MATSRRNEDADAERRSAGRSVPACRSDRSWLLVYPAAAPLASPVIRVCVLAPRAKTHRCPVFGAEGESPTDSLRRFQIRNRQAPPSRLFPPPPPGPPPPLAGGGGVGAPVDGKCSC